MTITDETTLDRFRGPGECDLCGKAAPVREPHHAIAKGMGGGSRLDVPENIVATSGHETFTCHCHRLVHDGLIPRRCVLTVIAHREGRTVDALERFLFALRRAPRGADVQAIRFDVFESAGREERR